MKHLVWAVGAIALAVSFFVWGPAAAQQPAADFIDIDYDADTCTVTLDFEDGTDFSTVLESSVQTGAVLDPRPDILINDIVGDQSQVLDEFTVEVGEHTITATLLGGETVLDEETQDVVCEPAPTPTATEEPTEEPTPEPTATEEPEPDLVVIECVGNVRVTTVNGETTEIVNPSADCVTPTIEPKPTGTTAPPPSGSLISPPSTGDAGLR